MIQLFAYDPTKNKHIKVGNFNQEDLTFHKHVRKNHFMRAEQGWGIQEVVVQSLIEMNCQQIYIYTSKKVYKSFFMSSLKNAPIKNYGHGDQRFLKLSEAF
jgi:hypothetical protein